MYGGSGAHRVLQCSLLVQCRVQWQVCCDPGVQRLCHGKCMQGVVVRVEVYGLYVAMWGVDMMMGKLMGTCVGGQTSSRELCMQWGGRRGRGWTTAYGKVVDDATWAIS